MPVDQQEFTDLTHVLRFIHSDSNTLIYSNFDIGFKFHHIILAQFVENGLGGFQQEERILCPNGLHFF